MSRNGRLIPLGGLSPVCGANSSFATAGINNLGEILVAIYSPGGACYENFIWRQGTLINLGGPPPGGYTMVAAGQLNDRDQVIGTLFGTTPDGLSLESQFVWKNGKYTLLPPLPNGNMYYPGGATASSINDFGVIAGSSGTAAGFRGVVWHNAIATDMGTCPGLPNSGASALNDLGMVVGACQPNGDSFVPFVWQDGKFTILPLPANGLPPSAIAGSINDLGQIVGEQYPNATFNGPGGALLWQDRSIYDLNTLIAPNDPLKPYTALLTANFINIQGQILATGQDSRVPGNLSIYYLLTPVN
jgi:uncharacterized membrane protein